MKFNTELLSFIFDFLLYLTSFILINRIYESYFSIFAPNSSFALESLSSYVVNVRTWFDPAVFIINSSRLKYFCFPFKWLRRPSKPSDRRNLIGDVVCYLMLTPLSAISAWLCIGFALRKDKPAHTWEMIGFLTLSVILLVIYMIWCLVSIGLSCQTLLVWSGLGCVGKC